MQRQVETMEIPSAGAHSGLTLNTTSLPPPFVRIDVSVRNRVFLSSSSASSSETTSTTTKITLDKLAEIERDAPSELEVSQLVRVLNTSLFSGT